MIRKTKQREAIFSVLEKANRPLTPQEIFDLALPLAPKLGLRTVYRCLSELAREQKVVGLDYPGQPPRYEIVTDGVHHPHFICRGCGKMFDLEKETPEIVYEAPPGFKIEGEEVIFYGRCPECG